MNENNINKSVHQKSLKIFFVKLISTSIVIIIVINLIFNLFFAERLEKIDKILFLDKKKNKIEFKQKIRNEISKGLNKENMIYKEDKILLYKLYLKIKKEFEDLDKTDL